MDELAELVANISERADHLCVMRDDHSGQLSRIQSNLSNISS